MRIFLGLTEVSGYYSNLMKGFDDLGVDAEYVSLHSHPFNYGETDEQSFLPKFARYCVNRRVSLAPGSWMGFFWLIMVLVARVPLFIWALVKFDIFIMGGGSSFFRYYEFPIIRLFGKKIIYMFHGTDSRPAYIDGFCEGIADQSNQTSSKISLSEIDTYTKVAKKRKKCVSMIEKYANVVIGHSAYAHFFRYPIIAGLIVGVPLKIKNGLTQEIPKEADCIQILHSPSQREGKGTKRIRLAISNLEARGYKINFVEISGRPNSEVLEEIQKCDFVVDQVYSDTAMAGFAAEAAFYGKPAILGGYYCEQILEDLPAEYLPPTIYCHPEKIESAIEKLITDRDLRLSLGQRAKDFVERNCTAEQVASRYLRIIKGDIPDNWIFDPYQTRYLHGCGMDEARARHVVKSVIEQYGREALQLSHNPQLEEMFVDFANSSDTK